MRSLTSKRRLLGVSQMPRLEALMSRFSMFSSFSLLYNLFHSLFWLYITESSDGWTIRSMSCYSFLLPHFLSFTFPSCHFVNIYMWINHIIINTNSKTSDHNGRLLGCPRLFGTMANIMMLIFVYENRSLS